MLYLLRHDADFAPADVPEPIKDETISEAVTVLEQLSTTEAERFAYEVRCMGTTDHRSREGWYAKRDLQFARRVMQFNEQQAQLAERTTQLAEQAKLLAQRDPQFAEQARLLAEQAQQALQLVDLSAQHERFLNASKLRMSLQAAVLEKFLLQAPPLIRRLTALEDVSQLERLTIRLEQSATAPEFEAALNSELGVPPG